MKVFIHQGLAVLLLLVGISLPVQADHSWGDYHWARSVHPLQLAFGDNMSGPWPAFLSAMPGYWTTPELLPVVVAGSTSSKRCRTSSGNVQVCNESYGFNGWLGVAGISVSSGHITSGYVKLNDSYFNNPAYDDDAWRQLVLCQEVGHTFGLDHQDEVFDNPNLDTCMDYTSNPLSNQYPNDHDYEMLGLIYSHLDGSGGDSGSGDTSGCNPRSPKCAARVPAAEILASIEMDGPAQWGRLISRRGPVEVYALDFGHGERVFTFVFWSLEHARGAHGEHH